MSVFVIKTAGYGGGDNLLISTAVSECGGITDGISFEHNNEGGWVISFEDLKNIYLLAAEVRDERT